MPTYRTAFISHAHADNVRCASIAALLKARGVNVWIDLNNAQVAHNLSAEIERELYARTAFVLMVTTASNNSRWVLQERSAFNFLMNGATTHDLNGVERVILPVHLGDEVPPFLGYILRIEGVGKSDAQVADEIADALKLDGPPPPPPPNEWDEIAISSGLYRLGLRGWRVRRTGVEFILPPTCDVAAGAFDMGSAESDTHAYDDEKPQYRIPVGAFAIGKYPVTVAEYACYLKANPGADAPPTYMFDEYMVWTAKGWRGTDLSWQAQQTRPDHPVVLVTWLNARDYAAWLAKTTSQPWRLPSEAEWEKAARWDEAKQHARIYPWGDAWDKSRANTSDGGPGRTTPIGSYPGGESPCHAQDMAGNVWEWTSSLSNPYPYNPAVSEALDNRTDVRVFRGGSWYDIPWVARAAIRNRYTPDNRDYSLGFRVVRGGGAGTT